MMKLQFLNATDFVTTLEKEAIISFLMANLDEYTDSRENISFGVEYALSKFPHQGGFVLVAWSGNVIVGVCVLNQTNFEHYFSQNLLIMIATSVSHRRQGIAKEMLAKAKIYTKGSIVARLKGDTKTHALLESAGFKPDAREFLLSK